MTATKPFRLSLASGYDEIQAEGLPDWMDEWFNDINAFGLADPYSGGAPPDEDDGPGNVVH